MDYEIKELGIGGILDQSLNLIKNNLGMLFKISFVSFVVTVLILGLFMMLTGTVDIFLGDVKSLENLPLLMMFGFAGVVLVVFVVYYVSCAAVVAYLSKRYLGETMTLKEAYGAGVRRLFPLMWTVLLKYLAIMLLTAVILSLVFIVWGQILNPTVQAQILNFGVLLGVPLLFAFLLYFIFRWGITDQVVVVEGLSGPKALKRSSFLMKKNKWKLLVITLLLLVCVSLIRVTTILFPNPIISVTVEVLTQLVSFFISSTTLTVLYFSARCQKESFDLQVLADSLATTNELAEPQATATAE